MNLRVGIPAKVFYLGRITEILSIMLNLRIDLALFSLAMFFNFREEQTKTSIRFKIGEIPGVPKNYTD